MRDRFRVDGKVAIVTGASSGLGAAFAQALAAAGADVALGARRADRLDVTAGLVERAGTKAVSVVMDVTSPSDCARLVDAAQERFGRVDILVNNAGLGTAGPASRERPEDFREVIDVNLMGSYWMAQACARVMERGSSIVNIGSVLGLTTNPRVPQAAYCASKSAIIGLTRDLAQQWTGRKGIRVNVVAPGYFLTEMTEKMRTEDLEWLADNRIPMGRLGELDECASAVVFLASEAASYISGTVLAVDGGLLTN
jgi:NAD(P)-dependent dehydrogenase (short-subunit alcohol dehydrogenase family)